MTKKVLHVISGISQQSGGPARSSQGLVAAERAAGVNASIYSFDGAEPWIDGVVVFRPDGHELSAQNVRQFDLVHVHGIWDPRSHRVCALCRECGVPYIVAPRGMLEPWSLQQKWLKKRIARFLYQDRDLKKAAALHATAESEAEQFRSLGFRNYCIISPNGVNVPNSLPSPSSSTSKRALFVSRMHPKKGVLELVEAWAKVKPKDWACEFVYTVSGEEERAYEAKVKNRVEQLQLDSEFMFTGRLDDDAKWFAYTRADLFVLPTYSENFGIVVAEALAAGVPVITTKGSPWEELLGSFCHSALVNECLSALVEDDPKAGDGRRETKQWQSAVAVGSEQGSGMETHALMNFRTNKLPSDSSFILHPSSFASNGRCGWWIDIGVEPLAAALREAINLSDDERHAMGENGRRLVEAKYTWPAIAEQMKVAYAWILEGGDTPPYVRL
jgi:glycosyltransferase involved in cell wall biosynthesis